jgi:hypothetical protein
VANARSMSAALKYSKPRRPQRRQFLRGIIIMRELIHLGIAIVLSIILGNAIVAALIHFNI